MTFREYFYRSKLEKEMKDVKWYHFQ
jgi:hypothetical protein